MHSKFDGKNEQSLFDLILNILEQLISEMAETKVEQPLLKMEIDSKDQDNDAVEHVEIFLNLIEDNCTEMIDGDVSLDRTSKKIRSMSKVLPHLIDQADVAALQMLMAVLMEYLTVECVDE